MADFTYSPLNQDVPEFRLLEISSLESNTSEDSPLLCTLIHERLPTEAGANYQTISYCWGEDKTPCMEILVNGKTLLVPKSADRTLRKIRSLSLASTVWIDAVCINQSDDIERGHQVALMNRIYRFSSGNIVDLGDDDGFAQRAYDNITAIGDEIKQESDDFRILRDLIMPNGKWVVATQKMKCETLSVFLTNKSFYMLKLISHHSTEDVESSVYPSWVPRLDKLRSMRDPSFFGDYGYRHADPEYWHEDWNPANGCLGIAQEDDANVLTLCGLTLDDIASTTPIVAEEDSSSFWSFVIETTSQSPNVYEPRFSRALTADLNYRHSRMTQDDEDCFQDFMAYLISNLTTPPVMSSLPLDAGVQVRRASQWWQAMNTACNNRCWAMTKTYELMALVPKISQAGDIIVSIPAAVTPHVLRPLADGYYHLLGECYLENHMDGEAFQKQMREGTPNVVFKIR